MKVLCILLCVAFASGFYIDNNGTHENKIVGGHLVRIEDLPYQASLFWMRIINFCGATIIDDSWLITAAHCARRNHSHILVRTGSGLRNILSQVHRVEEIIMHADFATNDKNNDIALIKLAQPLQFNNKQQPIELAKPHDIPRDRELMRISGFGKMGLHERASNVLMAAYVPVWNQADCERVYRSQSITDNMFCAGNGNADVCRGDSGGPGVIHGKLYGIISASPYCGSRTFPGVYTRVHKFYDWIVEKTELIF